MFSMGNPMGFCPPEEGKNHAIHFKYSLIAFAGASIALAFVSGRAFDIILPALLLCIIGYVATQNVSSINIGCLSMYVLLATFYCGISLATAASIITARDYPNKAGGWVQLGTEATRIATIYLAWHCFRLTTLYGEMAAPQNPGGAGMGGGQMQYGTPSTANAAANVGRMNNYTARPPSPTEAPTSNFQAFQGTGHRLG